MRLVPLCLAVLAPATAAACPGEVIFSCPIKGRILEICIDGGHAHYVFGPRGAPELALSESLESLDFQPWPGIGRTIWQSVRFRHADVVYEVWSSIDKLMEEGAPDPAWAGGVTVTRGDETLAELTCSAPPEPPFLEALHEAKEAAGQCWNFDRRAWQTAPCP